MHARSDSSGGAGTPGMWHCVRALGLAGRGVGLSNERRHFFILCPHPPQLWCQGTAADRLVHARRCRRLLLQDCFVHALRPLVRQWCWPASLCTHAPQPCLQSHVLMLQACSHGGAAGPLPSIEHVHTPVGTAHTRWLCVPQQQTGLYALSPV